MATPFRTGDGTSEEKIVCLLELVNNDWFKQAFVTAIERMCHDEVWEVKGDASAEFARDKANEMLESLVIDVIIPTLPIGTVSMWSIETPPAKWLICNAQSLLRADYMELFDVLGEEYGSVDGDHFTLPDYREYSPMGAGSTVGVGGADGSFLHAISPGEMPTHTHAVNDPGHQHTKALRSSGTAGGAVNHVAAPTTTTLSSNWVTDSAETGITINNAGSSTPMSLLHPVRGVHFIIYTGV